MGIIISYFRKRISTKEQLAKIHEEITSLEEYKDFTERRRKKLVGSLIAVSILFYLIAGIIVYFYYLPPTWEDRLLYATPFAGFIFLIYILKRLLTCYYRWKMRRNERKLVLLNEKKEDILDQVMETETYKVAKDILETYAPEQIRKGSMAFKAPVINQVVSTHRMPMPQGSELRKRIISPQPIQNIGPRPSPSTVSSSFSYVRPSITPRHQQSISRPSSEAGLQTAGEPPGPPMPRPILPRERSVLDRFVEYLVGDGPSNRYALVCRQCESHNGMALKDEFPYIAFRCAYCHYWNPARKQKPAAPPLESRTPRRSVQLSRRLMEKDTAKEEQESETTEEEDENDSESGSSSSSCLSSEKSEGEQVKKTFTQSPNPSRIYTLDKDVKTMTEPKTALPNPEKVLDFEQKIENDSQATANSAAEMLTESGSSEAEIIAVGAPIGISEAVEITETSKTESTFLKPSYEDSSSAEFAPADNVPK